MKLDHVGIAVRDLGSTLSVWENALGSKGSSPERVESQKVVVSFMKVQDAHIEFLEPLSKDSPISRFLEKRGEGLHHIALGVPDLAGFLVGLKGGGYELVDEHPRVGARGRLVAFAHPTSFRGVLTEFVQVDASGIEPETS